MPGTRLHRRANLTFWPFQDNYGNSGTSQTKLDFQKSIYLIKQDDSSTAQVMFKVHENVGSLNVLADSGYSLAKDDVIDLSMGHRNIYVYIIDISPGPINQRLVLTIPNRPHAKKKWWWWGLKSLKAVATVDCFHCFIWHQFTCYCF